MAARIWIDSFPNNIQSSQSNRIYSLRRSQETPAQPVAVYDIDYSEFKISNKDVGNATYTDFFRIPLFFNEKWKGYLFLLGSVGTVTIGMQLTKSLQDHVDSMVVIFWAAFFSLILAAITSGISERMVLFRGSYCILVVTLHAIGSGVNSTAVIWLMKYMQPVTCALTWNLELVFLMAFQYTFMSSVNPGLGNWLEIVGAVVCFLACTIGPLSELIVEWQESNKQGYEDLDAEQFDGSRRFNGLGHEDGGMAEFCLVNMVQVFSFPEHVPFKTAVLCEPLSNILNGLNIIGPLPQDSRILILGAGIAGMLFAFALHVRGYQDVTITQRSEARRQVVEQLGLGYRIVHPDVLQASLEGKDVDEEGFDLIIDATGNTEAISDAYRWLCKGGQLNIYGCCEVGREVHFPGLDFTVKQKTVTGTWLSNNTFPQTVPLVTDMHQRYLDFTKINIKEFAFDDYKEAFSQLKTKCITKAVLNINKL